MESGEVLASATGNNPGIIAAGGIRYRYRTRDQAPGAPPLFPHGARVRFEAGEENGRPVARRVGPGGPPSQTGTSYPAMHKAPYTFVPVVIAAQAGQAPLFDAVSHDGAGAARRLSGDLHLEIEALTPLLVGQYRYGHAGVTGNDPGYDEQKQILEPALITDRRTLVAPGTLLDQDGWRERRVLIPGESIKGAVRANLSAMLNAPMERVAERHFSYRPNLEWPKSAALRYQCREAVVTATDPLRMKVLAAGRHAIFVREEPNNGKTIGVAAGNMLPRGTTISDYGYFTKTDKKGKTKVDRNRLYPTPGAAFSTPDDYSVVFYAGGIDGEGLLAKTPTTGETKTYRKALVPQALIDGVAPVDVPPLVWQHYLATGEHLGDADRGHLAGHPGKFGRIAPDERQAKRQVKEAIARTADGLRVNQLVYVEIDTTSGEIVSFGHHFRYRWRYADSVRELREGGTRPELRPLACERVEDRGDGIAGRLSGARLLFGYALDKTAESGNTGIGERDCARLAGRIAINHAIEQVAADAWEPERHFLYRDAGDDDRRFLLPLPILGSPKPSAVEHYLDQTGVELGHGATRTYGDLPGIAPAGAALNGRKFYRHQAIEVPPGPLPEASPLLARGDQLKSEQATLARFVSRPTTRFHCTLRFSDLHQWELGALLLALQPERIRSWRSI